MATNSGVWSPEIAPTAAALHAANLPGFSAMFPAAALWKIDRDE